jgi:hypothetical protein
VTQLARRCAVLSIPVDPIQLYERDDPLLELWLWELVGIVESDHRRAEKATK